MSFENKPCLVQTSQGFSVNYKNKLLYSKYNPSKNIQNIVASTDILAGSIILAFSPVLEHGLSDLLSKLPDNCIVFAIEKEIELFNFIKENNPILKDNADPRLSLVNPDKLFSLPQEIEEVLSSGRYRRVLKIDFSAAISFNSDFYNSLYTACSNTVNQFWKNRITLQKFARLYNSNLFKNLKNRNLSISSITTSKPILVCGAGESTLETLYNIQNKSETFFIIAVDASLPLFKSLKIKPDAVICEETQSIISKAFIGAKNYFNYLFLSAVTTPIVARLNPSKTIFYSPVFNNSGFLRTACNAGILKNPIKPLGSVGLSAVEIALSIRKNEEIPVYVTGLDFSYSKGFTHAIDTMHEKNRRIHSNRLKSILAFNACFNTDAKAVTGKDNSTVYTTTPLSSYAELFKWKYEGTKNLYSAGSSGLNLNLPEQQDFSNALKLPQGTTTVLPPQSCDNTKEFLQQEKAALLELKNLFTEKSSHSKDKLNEKILTLLNNREYLFMHFPDGFTASTNQNFLNRVRIELDHFLKILEK